MSHKVDWNRVEDKKPPARTYVPIWWWDGKTVGLGRYYGRKPGILDLWGDDGWMTGNAHAAITHWAYLDPPEPPEGTALTCYWDFPDDLTSAE